MPKIKENKELKYLIQAGEELYPWRFLWILDGKIILKWWDKVDEDKVNEYIKKLKKKENILSIATITDQLNLMAWVLAEQVEAKPEEERTDLEKKALKVYKSIMKILSQ